MMLYFEKSFNFAANFCPGGGTGRRAWLRAM